MPGQGQVTKHLESHRVKPQLHEGWETTFGTDSGGRWAEDVPSSIQDAHNVSTNATDLDILSSLLLIEMGSRRHISTHIDTLITCTYLYLSSFIDKLLSAPHGGPSKMDPSGDTFRNWSKTGVIADQRGI